MPPHDNRRDLRAGGGAQPHQALLPKSNQKFLSIILRVIIMTGITTLFFVFLGVAAILLLGATAALHRHSGPSSKSSNGLSFKDLKKLPQFRFSRKKKGEAEADCAVCLDGMKQGQWCRKLSGCGHVFHRKCVDNWLVKVSGCPICRTKVELDDAAATPIEDRTFWGFD